jgi:threonine synthase
VANLPSNEAISHAEGSINIRSSDDLSIWVDIPNLIIKHEGLNPTGSFKDRGMTVAVSVALHMKQKILACASTGNTSSSLAAYAAKAGLQSIVFLPDGKVSQGKLAQTLGFGAQVFAIKGDFDKAMSIVQTLSQEGRIYLVNSVNPFRIEGQKTIIWELLQDLDWEAPDWIFVPGGNLGNTSAFGKAIKEAFDWGWITKKPKIVTVQAEGASPFYKSFLSGFTSIESETAETIATAIRIGNPVNYEKAVNAIQDTKGQVISVTDQEILNSKRKIDSAGIGCEPASAASLAGIKKLRLSGMIKKSDRVVAILTGHMLKDVELIENRGLYTVVEANLDAIKSALDNI